MALRDGLTETGSFDARYAPQGITLGALLDWDYTTDGVGNVLSIADALDSGPSRTYGYQDVHYFLTQGDGPWGTRSWSYDRIGNQLTETRNGPSGTRSRPWPGSWHCGCDRPLPVSTR